MNLADLGVVFVKESTREFAEMAEVDSATPLLEGVADPAERVRGIANGT